MMIVLILFKNCESIICNPFSSNFPLLYLLKTSENRIFPHIFKGYKSGTLVENGFGIIVRQLNINTKGTNLTCFVV